MTPEKIAALLVEAAPLDDAIVEIRDVAGHDGMWCIRFGALDVIVEDLPEAQQVAFSVVFPGPDDDRQILFYRALLAANSAWRSGGGVRYALGSAQGDIEISACLAYTVAIPAAVAATARGVAELAATWVLILDGQVAAEDQTDPMADFDPMLVRL